MKQLPGLNKPFEGDPVEKESVLQKARARFQPRLPKILSEIKSLTLSPTHENFQKKVPKEIAALFPKTYGQPFLAFSKGENLTHPPLRVGVVLSGGQAAGGHNVITGLFDALKKLNPQSQLFGFLNGPSGIIGNKNAPLTEEKMAPYRNSGGFDLIGAGRTKIETPEQFQASENTVKALDLDGLVIIGGDDSNTNAAFLAEHFKARGIKTRVVGVPKTIDGDLKNEFLEISFGFDTACKTFSEFIGNVLRDALSAKKYYFFIKVMGRSASHIALECALQTHPNMTLIGEEVKEHNKTVAAITKEISDMICQRSSQGKEFGVILIPEGLIEFIPECKILIKELNGLFAAEKPHKANLEKLKTKEEKISYILPHLSADSSACFHSFPSDIQIQLLLDRDPHGNVQVSKIETERLFIETVKEELARREKAGLYEGKFSAQPLFCGYEGRSCFPTNFDAQYCYALGHVAALLIDQGATGYMSSIRGLVLPAEEWTIGGIPLLEMMDIELRSGRQAAVIKKAFVNLNSEPYLSFEEMGKRWQMEDDYCYPGPIQFFGPTELTDSITLTLSAEKNVYSDL